MKGLTTMTDTWTFYGYWNTVLGLGDAEQVVFEFDLSGSSRRYINSWLGQAEKDAADAGGIEIPESWKDFHKLALDALCDASELV